MQNRIRDVLLSILGTLGATMVLGCVPADNPDDETIGSTAVEAYEHEIDETAPGALTDTASLAGRPRPRARFHINGIVGTGQSLSVGADAPVPSPAATRPRFNNLKLALGGAQVPPFDPAAPSLALVPLVEPIRPLAT